MCLFLMYFSGCVSFSLSVVVIMSFYCPYTVLGYAPLLPIPGVLCLYAMPSPHTSLFALNITDGRVHSLSDE